MTDEFDPRLALLARAAAWLALVEAEAASLDEAIAALTPAFREIAIPPCQCEREISASFDRRALEIRRQQLRAWRWSR